jgi:pimeloyl-ACP methyl ester carboxylesterase
MTWMQFGLRRDRTAKRAPEALVALLHDRGASAATIIPIAARWTSTVPTTAFIALDGIEELDAPRSDVSPDGKSHLGAKPEPEVLDRAVRNLDRLLEYQLRSRRLHASRLVLVGFGYGGTLALRLVLRGWSCAGVLSFSGRLGRPLPRILRIDCKVRLIDYVTDTQTDHNGLRDDVASLTARGIDARGVLLSSSPLSDEAIRHGGAYLVELVATAQRSDRFHVDLEASHA